MAIRGPPSHWTRQALQRLEDELACPVCLETLSRPRVLACQHTFCERCLLRLAGVAERVLCPTCRRATPLPPEGVKSLPAALYISFLAEIQGILRKEQEGEEGEAGAEEEGRSTASNRFSVCPLHPGVVLDLFCEECSRLVCRECQLEGHRGHRCKPASHAHSDPECHAHSEQRESVRTQWQQLGGRLETLGSALASVQAVSAELAQQKVAAEEAIGREFERLRAALEARREKLVSDVEETVGRKLAALAAQEKRLRHARGQLGSCLDFIGEQLEVGAEPDFLALREPMEKQMQALELALAETPCLPAERADVGYVLDTDHFLHACGGFGSVYVRSSAALNCTVRGSAISLVGEETEFFARVRDQHGARMAGPTTTGVLAGRLVSRLDGSVVDCIVEATEDGEHRLAVTALRRGRHELHVTMEEKDVSGSPFSVTVKSRPESLGTAVKIFTGLKEPWGVAARREGGILVAESGGKRVSLLDVAEEKVRQLIRHEVFGHSLHQPIGVAVGVKGSVFVTDVGSFSVQKYSPSGEFISQVGSYGYLSQEFTFPSGIGAHPIDDTLYITEWQRNNRVQIIGGGELEFRGWFGSGGHGEGELQSPSGVAFDDRGDVFVVDSDNHRVQVFSPSGKYKRRFGQKGTKAGQLLQPSGVFIDGKDVFIAERQNHRVSVFTTEGTFLHCFGCQGDGPGQFNHPHGVAVDAHGYVYVSDKENGRVQVF